MRRLDQPPPEFLILSAAVGRSGSFHELPVPLLLAHVTLGSQPNDTVVVSLRAGLEAAGCAAFVIALRLLLGRCCAGGDKSGQHRQKQKPAERRGHIKMHPVPLRG
jgi:hypothetical protein